MADSADAIRINGHQVSWGSIKVKVAGETFLGFTSLSYGDSLEVAVAHGMGKHQAPRGRSRGKYVVDPVKLGGPPSSMHALRQKLASMSPDGQSYGGVEFQIVAQYVEEGEPPMTTEIESCRYVKNVNNREEGSDVIKDEIEISAMMIRRNGLTLCDSSEGTPR
jgi:hypothetical protein